MSKTQALPQFIRGGTREFRAATELQAGLSEAVIPAVSGEYYSYSSVFTPDRPLYALLKCKSNKSRTLASARELGREVNLHFHFREGDDVRLQTVNEVTGQSISGDGDFDENWIALADMSGAEFYRLRSRRDAEELVDYCERACGSRQGAALDLKEGMVVAVMTSGNKFALFLVKEVTAVGVLVDACHILM